MSTLFSSIWLIDMALSGATILGQTGPGNDGSKGVHYILQYQDTCCEVFSLSRDAIGVFYSPSWLSKGLFYLSSQMGADAWFIS